MYVSGFFYPRCSECREYLLAWKVKNDHIFPQGKWMYITNIPFPWSIWVCFFKAVQGSQIASPRVQSCWIRGCVQIPNVTSHVSNRGDAHRVFLGWKSSHHMKTTRGPTAPRPYQKKPCGGWLWKHDRFTKMTSNLLRKGKQLPKNAAQCRDLGGMMGWWELMELY